jgi:hypothetical protein
MAIVLPAWLLLAAMTAPYASPVEDELLRDWAARSLYLLGVGGLRSAPWMLFLALGLAMAPYGFRGVAGVFRSRDARLRRDLDTKVGETPGGLSWDDVEVRHTDRDGRITRLHGPEE